MEENKTTIQDYIIQEINKIPGYKAVISEVYHILVYKNDIKFYVVLFQQEALTTFIVLYKWNPGNYWGANKLFGITYNDYLKKYEVYDITKDYRS